MRAKASSTDSSASGAVFARTLSQPRAATTPLGEASPDACSARTHPMTSSFVSVSAIASVPFSFPPRPSTAPRNHSSSMRRNARARRESLLYGGVGQRGAAPELPPLVERHVVDEHLGRHARLEHRRVDVAGLERVEDDRFHALVVVAERRLETAHTPAGDDGRANLAREMREEPVDGRRSVAGPSEVELDEGLRRLERGPRACDGSSRSRDRRPRARARDRSAASWRAWYGHCPPTEAFSVRPASR